MKIKKCLDYTEQVIWIEDDNSVKKVKKNNILILERQIETFIRPCGTSLGQHLVYRKHGSGYGPDDSKEFQRNLYL